MIQVSGLFKSFGDQIVFDDTGFSVNDRELVGLVGRNGSGKTTLLRIIAGEEKPDAGVIGCPNGYVIGYLSQHLSFSGDSVLKEACLGLKRHDDGRDETYKAETVLAGLGFSGGDFAKGPLDLSGGYQVRLHLARLLVSRPNLLLLDEPTNYLDIVSLRWLAGFLRSWEGEMILVTHDREFMDGVITHTMGVHRSKIKKIAGPTYKLHDQILAEEEVYERTRINEERKRRETEQFINRFRAQATRARAVQSRIKALRRGERLDRLARLKDLEFEFNSAPSTGKWLLEAKDISFSFSLQDGPLLQGLNLTVGRRDRIGVIGKNGKGKTTLLNLLAGELRPLAGSVVRHPQTRLAYFGQTNIQRLDPEKTVEEEMIAAHPEQSRNAARTICGTMMFEGDSALKKVKVLSGGEKSRVLLGKLIVSPANLLLLDEPSNHLDMESVDSLIEAIDAFEGAVVIVTHSEMILESIATRLVVFGEDGADVFEGTYPEFLEEVGWRDEGPVARGKKPETACNGGNRRDLKRSKAELINERSRVLTPLRTRIAAIEEEIMRLEKTIESDTQGLIDASVKGDPDVIRRLSVSSSEAKQKIDLLFDELEARTNEMDRESRAFEERLEALRAAEIR